MSTATKLKIVKYQVARPALWLKYGSDANWSVVDRIAVYPRLNLAYNRVRKNANTTVVSLLNEIETGNSAKSRREAKHNSGRLYRSPSALLKIRSLRFFVVIRNPYTRVLSAFLDKFRYEPYLQAHGRFDLTPAGFEKFLVYLRQGGLAKDGHWDLQIKSLLLPLARYDGVIRFENLREELGAFLQAMKIQIPAGRLDAPYATDEGKATSAGIRASEFYDGRIREVVASLYREDFDALDYDPALPPFAHKVALNS
jgi:Sulfotransferase family